MSSLNAVPVRRTRVSSLRLTVPEPESSRKADTGDLFVLGRERVFGVDQDLGEELAGLHAFGGDGHVDIAAVEVDLIGGLGVVGGAERVNLEREG